jgi:hypothetical protein
MEHEGQTEQLEDGPVVRVAGNDETFQAGEEHVESQMKAHQGPLVTRTATPLDSQGHENVHTRHEQPLRSDSREESLAPSTVPSLLSGSTGTLLSHAPDTPPQHASTSLHHDDIPRQTGHTSDPSLDAETQEDLDAVAQAEEGGEIAVDSEDVSTDAGYESDSRTSASTSLASSVRDYAFENGRRYHKFREGRYAFPNDDVEQEREDMKHAMVKMLCQQLHFAPIGPKPQEILDIGTGTGIWAIESEFYSLCPM